MKKESIKKKYFTLLLCFLKIGAFTFGGGYAMIPLVQREMVEKHGWMKEEDILEIIAVAESTPGPIAVNMATFVGYKIGGFFGAFLATFGVVFPSFLVISILSFVIQAFQENRYFRYAFEGIRAGVLALIFKALLSMAKNSPKNLFSYLVMAFAFLASAVLKMSIPLCLCICALAGMVYSALVFRYKNE